MVKDSESVILVGDSKMFDWNYQDQVGVLLWDKHKKNDHILKRPRNEILLTFGEYSKKKRDEDASNTTMSAVETSGTNHDFIYCNGAKRSCNSSQDCNDSSLHMDAWSDLPYLRSVLVDGFNDGSDQDSVVTELMNDLADSSNQYSGVGIMTRYNNSSEMFPNKPCSLSTCDAMKLGGEPDPFGHDYKGNDSFSDYVWANIEDLDDLDKIFRHNDSFDGNEKFHNINSFHNTSTDITSNTSQSIPVPDVMASMERTSDAGSPYHQFGEYSDGNVNSLLIKKDVMASMERTADAGYPYHQFGEYSDRNVNSLLIKKECSSNNQTQDATPSSDNMEAYKQKQSTPEISYLEEQCQPQVMSLLINGCSLEVSIYHQLQYAMQKLDVRIRLNIRDSLFRLASSTMERFNTSDASSTDKSKDEYEISMDKKSESNNHDRSSSMPDSERVTNPIDRIVAHLLFHNSSGSYLLPIEDGNVPRASSMRHW